MKHIVRSLTLFTVLAGVGHAQEQELGWSDTAELSLVATYGNAEAQTFGFKNSLVRRWENASFQLEASGLRAETTRLDPKAFGTAADFSVDLDEETEPTAEAYTFNGRYRQKITERLFWYAGAGWERNRFAGIDNRYTGIGGLGHTWVDRERRKFRTEYGVTYTYQEDVIEDPEQDEDFLGARFEWDFLQKLGSNTTYTNDLVLDENLDETDDFRADMTNALSVAMNSRLALKVSLQLLFDNQPSLEAVPLFADAAFTTPVLDASGEQVEVQRELDELDSVFTVSLVVNF